MTRLPRPSQVYRLPADPASPTDSSTEHAGTAARNRPPHRRWVLPAVVVAVAVLAVAVLATGQGDPQTPDEAGGLVDVLTEDEAVAILQLYSTEAAAVDALRGLRDILQPPGPSTAAAVAADHADAVVTQTQATRGAEVGGQARTYGQRGEHGELVGRLRDLAQRARQISVLAATHDTLYGGAGAISLPDARQQLLSMFANAPPQEAPEPLRRWAEALLEQLSGGQTADEAHRRRAEATALWAAEVDALEVPLTENLRNYIDALPDETVRGLRGHPVAGPALERLRA